LFGLLFFFRWLFPGIFQSRSLGLFGAGHEDAIYVVLLKVSFMDVVIILEIRVGDVRRFGLKFEICAAVR